MTVSESGESTGAKYPPEIRHKMKRNGMIRARLAQEIGDRGKKV